MFGLGLPEIVIISIVVVFLFSGGDKLAEIGRGIGRFTGEFKKGKDEMERAVDETKKELEVDKLSEISKGLGRFTSEFRKGKEETGKKDEKIGKEAKSDKK